MTTPDERTRAVLQTRRFLQLLTDPVATPDVPETVREEARRLLRHYPGEGDMSLAHTALPIWFGEPPPHPGGGRWSGAGTR